MSFWCTSLAWIFFYSSTERNPAEAIELEAVPPTRQQRFNRIASQRRPSICLKTTSTRVWSPSTEKNWKTKHKVPQNRWLRSWRKVQVLIFKHGGNIKCYTSVLAKYGRAWEVNRKKSKLIVFWYISVLRQTEPSSNSRPRSYVYYVLLRYWTLMEVIMEVIDKIYSCREIK